MWVMVCSGCGEQWYCNRSTRRPTDDVCRNERGEGCGRPLPPPVPEPGWTPPMRRKTDNQTLRRQRRLPNEEWYGRKP